MKNTIRIIASTAAAVLAAGALTTGCTAGDELLPPAGQVSMTYLSSGTNTEIAVAYAYFLSDFVANDPADDPSVNPYADLGEGECVAPISSGSGTSSYTYVDVGDVILSGPATITLVKSTSGGVIEYTDYPDPGTFPFSEFFTVELTGSTEVGASTFGNALATGDQIAFTSPAGMASSLVTFPDSTDLLFTYQTTLSEIMIISITDLSGANGLMCRVSPGVGGATDFTLAAADVASLPASGFITAFTYNYRDDILTVNGEDRTVTFVGQTVRAVQYQKN